MARTKPVIPEPHGFKVGDVVEWDRMAYLTDMERGNLALLEARAKPPIYGQVVECVDHWVEVCWENGRTGQYSRSATYRGDIKYLRRINDTQETV